MIETAYMVYSLLLFRAAFTALGIYPFVDGNGRMTSLGFKYCGTLEKRLCVRGTLRKMQRQCEDCCAGKDEWLYGNTECRKDDII